jgi:hypothetical protein
MDTAMGEFNNRLRVESFPVCESIGILSIERIADIADPPVKKRTVRDGRRDNCRSVRAKLR